MQENFNQLSPAETERLAILIEEMGEAIQAACKILRHGYEKGDPTRQKFITNRQWLETELGHVRNSMIMLCECGDLSKGNIHASAEAKKISISKWTHHQE